MLGVDHDASTVELRARYRALARELHPDHRHDEASSAAGQEMAALNEAWAVLSDPVRRRAYDRELADLTNLNRTRSVASTVSFTPANPPPMSGGSSPVGCLAAAAGVVPWVALLIVLGVIFVFTAYAGSGRDDEPTGAGGDVPMVRVRDLRGSCVQLLGGATVVVDCLTTPNEGRIVAQASRGGRCPEGTEPWDIRQQDVLACTEPGTGVGPGR